MIESVLTEIPFPRAYSSPRCKYLVEHVLVPRVSVIVIVELLSKSENSNYKNMHCNSHSDFQFELLIRYRINSSNEAW